MLRRPQYPAWWNDTVTIYNKIKTGSRIAWQQTVLGGAYFDRVKEEKRKPQDTATDVRLDYWLCRLREDSRYISPVQWDAITEKAGVFTLKTGDIILHGIGPDIDEYTAGQRSTDLINQYFDTGCFVVKVVNINTKMLAPHYYTEGTR